MTRINAVRSIATTRNSVTRNSVTWGKNTGALIFAAVLIVCSVTVGCSSDKDEPKPVANNIQVPVPPTPSAVAPMPTPSVQPAAKPAPKKVVAKKPATVNYADKTYAVTFEYPRRYAIETGDAAADLLTSNPIAMNFIQPGGVALAAVELPETGFANTDFSSAFFDVSVHKSLNADQCTEFAVPQPKGAAVASGTESTSNSGATSPATSTATSSVKPATTSTDSVSTPAPTVSMQPAAAQSDSPSNSKLMVGDLELRATEAVSGEGTRQSDSKYFHVYQNGSCYEFALNVTTDASAEGLVKHVDRDKVFNRLEQILATVKIDTVKIDTVKTTTDAAADVPSPTPAAAPAQ